MKDSLTKMIKLLIRLAIIGFAAFLILFTVAYIFVTFQGRSLIIKNLEAMTGKKVTIGYFELTPPFNLEIKGLKIEGMANLESIFIAPSLPYFLTGRVGLSRIIATRPEIIFERLPEATANQDVAAAPKTPPSVIPEQKKAKKESNLRIVVKRLKIKEGKITFIDHTISQGPLKIIVKNIDFNLNNFSFFSSSRITNFDFRGSIPWQEGQEEGKILAEGWINFSKSNMQALLKIEDIDGIYLYPYYSNWVDLGKARIEKAKLNFTSNIQGLNNDVTAECRLELTNIARKPLEEGESQEKASKITDAVLDIFKALNQGRIVLDFTIRTKMNRPEFGFGNIKMAFEDKLAQGRKGNGINPQDVFILPGKIVEGTFKGIADLTAAVIGGTISAGKEVGKAVEGAFKKEKTEEKKE